VKSVPELNVAGRRVGPEHPPLVIAEIGINHEGDVAKALRMVDDAAAAGCECVKFQSHVIDDEMIPNDVIPGNASESIWDIMERCALTEDEERTVKSYVESKGLIFLSTPFSRAAAERLESMDVPAYKIGSGECNNYPLVEHIAKYGKPVIMSTGMNDIASIAPAVEIFRRHDVPYALLHVTSMYPTPYDKVRLGAIASPRSHSAHRFSSVTSPPTAIGPGPTSKYRWTPATSPSSCRRAVPCILRAAGASRSCPRSSRRSILRTRRSYRFATSNRVNASTTRTSG